MMFNEERMKKISMGFSKVLVKEQPETTDELVAVYITSFLYTAGMSLKTAEARKECLELFKEQVESIDTDKISKITLRDDDA